MHTISLHNWEVYLFYFILCQIYDMDILNWIWFFCTSPHIFSNISLYIHSRCLVKHKDCKYFHKYHKKWSCRLKSTSCMYAYEILLWISADYNVLWKNLKIYNFCYEISKWFEYKVHFRIFQFSHNFFRKFPKYFPDYAWYFQCISLKKWNWEMPFVKSKIMWFLMKLEVWQA